MRYAPLLITITVACAPFAMSQGGASEAAFIDSARGAAAKYQDRAVAIAEGYRQIGTDFPGMGEHWINIGLVFDGKFDPAHPEVLTYVTLSGKPYLLGVAYVLPLLAGESAPNWPVGKEKWHDHFRTVEDETELPQHHAPGHGGDVPRLAMLHVWTGLANPAGMFTADNWAIPYFRLGITPAEGAADAAAKALALVSGGTEYFSASIHAAVPLSPSERKKVDAALARSRSAVETLRPGSASTVLTPSDVENLSAIWTRLWKEIDSSVSSKARSSLQPLPIR